MSVPQSLALLSHRSPFPPTCHSPVSARSRQLVLSLKPRERAQHLAAGADPKQVPAVPEQGGRSELRPGEGWGQPQSSYRLRALRVSTPSPVCASVHPAAVCPRPWRSCWCSPSWDWGWHSSGITGLLICELGCSPPLSCLSYPLPRPGSLLPSPSTPKLAPGS